jgi:hypothetical protein
LSSRGLQLRAAKHRLDGSRLRRIVHAQRLAGGGAFDSENVFVNWGNLKLAGVYLEHFSRNHALARPFTSSFQ